MSKLWLFNKPGEPGFYAGFSYDRGFIEALKASVPSNFRRYLPDPKLWWIADPYFSTVLRLGYIWFDEVIDKTRPESKPEPKPTPAITTPHSILFLLPTAPEPVVKAAYRALSKMYHPDAGGDAEQMKLINWAYEAIGEMAQ